MNNKPISIIIAGTVLGSLITTTSYAWPPSEACVNARAAHKSVMCVIKSCKNFDPRGAWICSDLSRPDVTEMKKDCMAILRHECRPDDFPDEPEGYCDPDALEPVPCPSVVGTWAISIDLDCDEVGDINRTMVFYNNETWNGVGFPNGGPWTQKCCNIEMVDNIPSPPMTWNATMTDYGDQLSFGTISNEAGFDACWTATRLIPDGFSAVADVEEQATGMDYYDENVQ